MSTKLGRIARAVGIIPAVYTVGLGLAGYLARQRWGGHLTVINEGELGRSRPGGTLVIANHPSLMEPWVLLGLYARQYLRNPWRAPWSTPDFGNFVNHWYGQWLRVRCIPIRRGGDRSEVTATLGEIARVLRHGATVIIFPEGGRTSSIRNGERYRISRTGRKIRPFKIRRLLEQLPVDTRILPVWVERRPDDRRVVGAATPGGWEPTTVVVGSAELRINGLDPADLVRWYENQLLSLADTLPPATTEA